MTSGEARIQSNASGSQARIQSSSARMKSEARIQSKAGGSQVDYFSNPYADPIDAIDNLDGKRQPPKAAERATAARDDVMATRRRTTDKPHPATQGHPRPREPGDAATHPLVTSIPGAPKVTRAWRGRRRKPFNFPSTTQH